MRRRMVLRLGGFGAAALVLTACAGGQGASPQARQRGGLDVIGVAERSGAARFARAVRSAELEDALSGSGPYTLFAPVDRAFGASDADRLDRDGLRRLIAYHVVPGQLTSDFLLGVDVNHTTLLGSSLNVDGSDDRLRVNGAGVVRPDLAASNGVVFLIDRVLAPR